MSTDENDGVKRMRVSHPVLTPGKKVDLVETYKKIANRYPKVMARLRDDPGPSSLTRGRGEAARHAQGVNPTEEAV